MDVLSDVITLMRAGEPSSARFAWSNPWERHFPAIPGAAGFVIVRAGTCRLRPPGDAAEVTLYPGDVVFRPHGRAHTLSGDGPTVTICGGYRLDETRIHPLLTELPELVRLSVSGETVADAGLRTTVDLLAAELERSRPGRDAIVAALLDLLLAQMLRTWLDNGPAVTATTGWAAALQDPVVSAALHAMHDDPARPWTVATLAAAGGLSRAPFARRFAARTGRPPLTYLTWWRMTTASRLLRDTDASISTVAARVGYTSEFAFAAAFKRHFGTAPGRYRGGALSA